MGTAGMSRGGPGLHGSSVAVCRGPWPIRPGRHGPQTLVGKETVVFIFFRREKKKIQKIFFFFKQALSFRRNLGMLLFKKKSVCNVSVTRFFLSMIYVRKWFFLKN